MLVLQTFYSFILCVSWRALAVGDYLWTGVTDAILLILSFSIIKRVMSAEGVLDRIAYVVGGVVASLLSIWFTKAVWGH